MESKSTPSIFELAAGELAAFAQRCDAMARTLDVRTVPHSVSSVTGIGIKCPADSHAAARAAQLRKVAEAARARVAYLLGTTAPEHEKQRQQARADNERNAEQLRQVHELLDRLGAPGNRDGGSPRERLFYLIEKRGWEPNVSTPHGADHVADPFPPNRHSTRSLGAALANAVDDGARKRRDASDAIARLPGMVHNLLDLKRRKWCKSSPGYTCVRVLEVFVDEFRRAVQALRDGAAAGLDVMRPRSLEVAAVRFEREMRADLAVAHDFDAGGKSVRLQAPEGLWEGLNVALNRVRYSPDANASPCADDCNCERCR